MQKKHCIIDASVLLHDPEAFRFIQKRHIVIPSAVLEELDRKKRFNDEIGRNARYVMRFIDEVSKSGNIREKVELENGSSLQILLEEDLRKQKHHGHFFSPDKLRYKLLMSALQLKGEGKDIIVLSKDPVTKIIAETMGIPTEGYSSHREEYDSIERRAAVHEIDLHQFREFKAEGRLSVALESAFLPNSFHILQTEQGEKVLTRFDARKKAFVPLVERKDLWGVKPRNYGQKCAVDLLLRPEVKLVTFIGSAGTGKTLLALAAGLKQVFDDGLYQKIILSRSIIPLGKDIGFLPGSKEDKLQAWLAPFFDNLDFICNVGKEDLGKETKKWIVESEKFQVEAITYMRGRSFSDTFVIIDEAQNLTPHELKTIISRVGENTKIVILGDPTQIDNPYLDRDSNGLVYLVGRMKHYDLFGSVFFEQTERSQLAKLAADVL